MNKERLAKVVTVLLLLGILLGVGARSGKIALGWQLFSINTIDDSDAGPQDVIYTMLDSANAGNSETFISCFSGEIERKLRQTQIEMTPTPFSNYLASTQQAIKGIAMERPVLVSDHEAKIQIQYVYQDRTEVQEISLRGESKAWKITRLGSSRPKNPSIAYGTPVQ